LVQINSIIAKEINEIKAKVVSGRQSLSQLEQQYSEAIQYLQLAKIYHEFIINSGTNIVFGEPDKINILNKLIYRIQNPNQITNEDLVNAMSMFLNKN